MKPKLAYIGRGALNLVFVLAVVLGLQAVVRGRVPDAVGVAIVAAVVIASYVAGVRWIERRYPAEMLARAGIAEFAAGLALGIGLFTAVILLLWAVKVYRPSGWGTIAPLPTGFLFALSAAVFEETLFRGFLFRLIEKLIRPLGALAITSALFGAAHAFNPGATVRSSVAIALEAGVLLGAAWMLTQRLWMPIGLHLGWNFAEGSVFGMSVSGGAAPQSLIRGTLRGPDLLTGGLFGPEASIIAVLVCLAAATILLARYVVERRAAGESVRAG